MTYYVLACLWGIYTAWMQSKKPIHNTPEWLMLNFLINTVFMPISILVYAYRKWIVEAEDLK